MEDTIAAISTSTVSSGGISVVRISGENALSVAQQVFRSKKNKNVEDMESHTVHYGNIYNGEELIDEVLMIVMKAPNTYTREDVVEIDCHGGILVTKKVLEAVLSAGARLAEPGEFTKRAFLNGRIDLSQAEAVIDVIQSKNEYALKSSVRQLSGKLSEKIKGLRELVLNNVAYIEAALDDSNVDRFAKYLHKLTKNTQFIVITHRRGTMVSSDRLYGITMQEKGVSTLVSVNLVESELEAQAKAGRTKF